MPKRTPKEYAEFYRFWLWEYTKRNAQFRADYAACEAGELSCAVLSKYGFNVLPPSGRFDHSAMDNQYADAEEVLTAVLQGELKYRIPGFVEDYTAVLPAVFDNGEMRPDWVARLRDKEQPEKLFAIDLSAPLELILAELTAHYESHHGRFDPLEAFDCQLRRRSALKRLPSREADLPRAIGLWLWDQCDLTGEKPAKAIKVFRERFQNAHDADNYLDKYLADADMHRLYTITADCIDQLNVKAMG
jgi:hypothetical protein